MDHVSLLYCTTPDPQTAETIANTLLDEALIACANILPGSTSLYLWKDQRERTSEALLLIKTSAARVPEVKKRVLELHPYETPCVLEFRADGASDAFAAWVSDLTGPKPAQP